MTRLLIPKSRTVRDCARKSVLETDFDPYLVKIMLLQELLSGIAPIILVFKIVYYLELPMYLLQGLLELEQCMYIKYIHTPLPKLS